MKRWRSKLLLLGGAAAFVAAIPAFSQDSKAPESLLPPGFGEPSAPLPPPAPQPAQPRPEAPRPAAPPPASGAAPAPIDATTLESAALEDLAALEEAERPKPIEIPDASRRSIDAVGPLRAGNWGLGEDAFAGADGRYLSTLMRRLDAPLPSRWTSILLRRALLSHVPAARSVHPVDWVAERAWLLLRMGEADGARMLVQSVDVDRFTPKMFSVAVQSALANADPAGLCPLIEPGRATSDEPVWALGDAMCAALEGDAGRASALIDQARRRGRARGVDLLLAEKVIGAGVNTRRSVTIQWDSVDRLNSWRFGLAAATGVAIPDRLMDGAGAHIHAWQARAPMLPLDQRIAAADTAASLGVFSNAALVEMQSLIADGTDPSEIRETVGGQLRQAYVAADMEGRMTAIRRLWDEAETPTQRFARQILTAAAAARITPAEAFEGDADGLIASMLTAGFDQRAARWSGVVSKMDGAAADRSWALLAIASPRPIVEISTSRITSFHNRDDSKDSHRSKMLLAALAGLARIDGNAASQLAGDMELQLGARNMWSDALDRAAAGNQRGTVALLAAVGMQTGGWAGVPANHLYHIVSALRRVGLEYEARMIAAEALARL